jgi:hypothetical protein
MENLLKFEVARRKTAKISIIYHAEFKKALADVVEKEDDIVEVCLRATSRFVINDIEVYRLITQSHLIVQDRIDDFLENGSGWVFNGIRALDLELGNCNSLNGSCNKYSVKFTKDLKKIKPSNKKNNCFFHAVAYHFVRKDNAKKLDNFIAKYLNITIPNPVCIKDIPKFENENGHLKFKINVLYIEDDCVYPLLFSKNIKAKHHITLVLYKTVMKNKVVNHYTYVTDVDKFLQKNYKGDKKTYDKSIRCLNCFTKFSYSENAVKNLNVHYKLCLKNKPQSVQVPTCGSNVQFKNFKNKFCSNYVGFFDFESRHVKPEAECSCTDKKICQHKTKILAVQEPITVSFMILDSKSKIVLQHTYSGHDCVKYFLNILLENEEDLLEELEKFPKYCMSEEDELLFKQSFLCHICEKVIEEQKVRDHCHVTGKFLGAAHNTCNLLRTEKKKIPMFCHNFTGYDGHFLVQHLGGDERITKLEGLPYNTEKFRTIQLNSFVFLDSLSFLNASLSELMNDLVRNKNHDFGIIRQQQLYTTKLQKKLLLRKGVFPYEFVTSLKKLKKTKSLPPPESFHSTLTNSDITVEDYQHARKVFRKFKCRNMLDYTELYCKLDVGILAEVVQQFRGLVYQQFGLDCW